MENITRIYSKYINYKNLDYNKISYLNNIPRIVHRTLLFDKEFPSEFHKLFISFNYNSSGYITLLWREKDLLEILDNIEQKIYLSYKHRIQKTDFARYIILKKYGGIYADFDIYLKVHLDKVLLSSNKGFISIREKGTPVDTRLFRIRQILPSNERQEHPIRIANYFIASSKEHIIWNNILLLCIQRFNLKIKKPYDILFTTGPDIITTAIHKYNTSLNNNNESIYIIMNPLNMIEHIQNTKYHNNKIYWKNTV